MFFREIGSRGAHKIPQGQAVILACAPHANQFLDGIVVVSGIPVFVRVLVSRENSKYD
jgi:hypothetical protein